MEAECVSPAAMVIWGFRSIYKRILKRVSIVARLLQNAEFACWFARFEALSDGCPGSCAWEGQGGTIDRTRAQFCILISEGRETYSC